MDMSSICTAEYIAPNIILTAQHCVVDDNNDITVGRKIKYLDCKGNEVWASVTSYGDNAIYKGKYNRWGVHSVPVDWALLSVDDPEFYSSAMFGLKDVTGQHNITVDNAGWGAMPILSDKQIKDLRKSFTEFATEQNGANFSQFDKLFRKQFKIFTTFITFYTLSTPEQIFPKMADLCETQKILNKMQKFLDFRGF